MTAKKRTKKRDACAKLLFCQLNRLLLWRSRSRRRRRILSSLINNRMRVMIINETYKV